MTLLMALVALSASPVVASAAEEGGETPSSDSAADSEAADSESAAETLSSDESTDAGESSGSPNDGDSSTPKKSDTDERADSSDSKEPKEASESKSDSDGDSQEMGSFFEAPAPYTVGVGLSTSILFWDTAHGGRESQFMLMGSGHARVFGPLLATLSVGYARNAPTAGPLVAANNHVAAMAGLGAEGWLNTLRFSLQGQGGILYRHLELAGGGGTSYTDSRIAPLVGGRFSIGTSFIDRLLVSMVGGVRFYAPERSEVYAGIEAGWLFVHRK